MNLKVSDKQAGFFILSTGIILSYFFDAINKLCLLYYPDFSRFAIVYRLFLQVFCISVIIVFFNRKRLIWLLSFFYFFLCFVVGNLYLKYYVKIDIVLSEQFIYFNKYFFIFFIFFATYKALEDELLLLKVVEIFKKIFILNGFVALIGLFFKIELFSTFPSKTDRFGYDGLINAQNEASIFYLLGLLLFYYEWKTFKKPIHYLLISLFFCFLSGMKAVFFGVFLLCVYHFFLNFRLKKIFYLFLILTSFFLLVLSLSSRLNDLLGYFIYHYNRKGFLYVITGGRNSLIESRVLPHFQQIDLVNFIFGGQNVSNPKVLFSLVEMDFIDIILFFGIFNSLFFLICFKKFIVGQIRTGFFNFVVFMFFLLSFFAGHFFTSSVNVITILIVFSCINFKQFQKNII